MKIQIKRSDLYTEKGNINLSKDKINIEKLITDEGIKKIILDIEINKDTKRRNIDNEDNRT